VAGSVFRGVEFSGSASLVSEMEKLGVVISWYIAESKSEACLKFRNATQ
jgi:hypothetical protein